jgi:hypothetical protein
VPRDIDISYSGCHRYFMIKKLDFWGGGGGGGGGETAPGHLLCS